MKQLRILSLILGLFLTQIGFGADENSEEPREINAETHQKLYDSTEKDDSEEIENALDAVETALDCIVRQ